MIIYIHGFCGSGEGLKAKKFKQHYKNIIAPSLSYVPELAIQTLEELIESYLSLAQDVQLICSSMGGYMGIYLSNKYDLKCVLINPALYHNSSFKTLQNAVGLTTNFYDKSRFEWKEEHISMLEKIKTDVEKGSQNFLLFLKEKDEVLDYKVALEYFSDKIESKNIVVDSGGTHGYNDIESKFQMIDDFFKLNGTVNA